MTTPKWIRLFLFKRLKKKAQRRAKSLGDIIPKGVKSTFYPPNFKHLNEK